MAAVFIRELEVASLVGGELLWGLVKVKLSCKTGLEYRIHLWVIWDKGSVRDQQS